ncbi:copper homeostasis protein CutC [Flavobacteriaceae bacterium R38]|nr:copper homeostasis protein CutC [Flavobacteriaceae bacterium R38]
MIIEICANSYESAMNAQNAGADRIELCSELTLGGITPSYGLLKKVMKDISIPVHVLIRPRRGDFTYNEDEFEIMKENIMLCKELNCNGIVSGILKKDHSLDIERTTELIKLTKPLSFTFHRAFDWVPKPIETLDKLISLKANRILSSGQAKNAFQGLELLKTLLKNAENKIEIMPGSGVNAKNIVMFKREGFREIHFSATSLYKNTETPGLSMSGSEALDEGSQLISDIQKIRSIKRILEK